MTPTEMILRYFRYDHLPAHLQEVSKPFCETTALRKLLEAKDCYVRARLNEIAQA